ncbi:MAG: fibrillarin-like rRNA/tRNA 2'-O-methyltransferase [Promethearchaeota archaeon]
MKSEINPHSFIKGIFWLKEGNKSRLATLNMYPGVKVYGERLFTIDNKEYRQWDPYRSKFAAALLTGIKSDVQFENQRILYLGAASGTTCSHFSDIVRGGVIYCVEFARRSARDLFDVCETRNNMIPILADARKPAEFATFVQSVDLIYQDLAQPDQSTILSRNIQAFLKEGGIFILALKARSIDVTQDPQVVFQEQINVLEKEELKVKEVIDIDRYEKDHCLVIGERS